jgi:ABC-type nitrate/sulfonate/bicarbonate transport system ATPase subunit
MSGAPPPRLEVCGLSATYAADSRHAEVAALRDVSFELRRGEFVSIVGPSGCGKTTLLKMLAGLLVPSAGQMLIDGVEPPELLGRLGYMPQNDHLMPWRTTLDNVTLGLELAGTGRPAAREIARRELELFGLAGFEDHWPRALSGGMRQRAALLRTFLAGRDVLLLDEPFGALDALTREAMREWLLGVWEADRKTILLVTHDVEEALFLSDRVLVMCGRPGHITTTLEVPLPRPRALALTGEPGFAALKEQLLAPLREEARLRLTVAAP